MSRWKADLARPKLWRNNVRRHTGLIIKSLEQLCHLKQDCKSIRPVVYDDSWRKDIAGRLV